MKPEVKNIISNYCFHEQGCALGPNINSTYLSLILCHLLRKKNSSTVVMFVDFAHLHGLAKGEQNSAQYFKTVGVLSHHASLSSLAYCEPSTSSRLAD